MGQAVSGLWGVINAQKGISRWNLTKSIQNGSYVASNTKQATVRMRGIEDANGGWTSQSVIPLAMPGQRFAFQGDAGVNVAIPGQHWIYSGNVILAQLQVAWDWTMNKPITYTYTWAADGPITQTSAAPLADASEEVGKSSFDNFIYVGDSLGSGSSGGAGTKLCARTATLTITSKLVQNADSCTEGTYQRLAGPLDWALALNFAGNDLAGFWQNGDSLGDIIALRADVDSVSNSHWFLKWGRVGDLSNLQVNVESGEIISATANVAMSAYDDDDVLGQITKPSASGTDLWWPDNTNLALIPA
jgi:hypothetical protein